MLPNSGFVSYSSLFSFRCHCSYLILPKTVNEMQGVFKGVLSFECRRCRTRGGLNFVDFFSLIPRCTLDYHSWFFNATWLNCRDALIFEFHLSSRVNILFELLCFLDLVEFTDEEGYGKYLDLHECYVRFINLKGIEVRCHCCSYYDCFFCNSYFDLELF